MQAHCCAGLPFRLGLLVLVAAIGCSTPTLTALPDNPCDLLSARQVAAAAALRFPERRAS
jgi:hypothetical protein